jgi:hypothetical protein
VKFSLSFLTKPLQIFGLVGLLSFLPGLLICSYLVIARVIANQSLSDRPLFLLGILLVVVGIQFISLGLIAEIQMRTYYESVNKATYTIRRVLKPDGAEKQDLDYVGIGRSNSNRRRETPAIVSSETIGLNLIADKT